MIFDLSMARSNLQMWQYRKKVVWHLQICNGCFTQVNGPWASWLNLCSVTLQRNINLKNHLRNICSKDNWTSQCFCTATDLSEAQGQKTYLRYKRKAMIQISRRIHAVWSEPSLGASWIAKEAKVFQTSNEERGCAGLFESSITKTNLYNFDPLNPTFI